MRVYDTAGNNFGGQGYLAIYDTNGRLVGTNGAGGVVNLSAGTTSNNLTAMVFSNSNNVSFGLNGSTVTASVTVASTQGSINFSAGTTSGNLSNVVFSNSNGMSFGLNGSTITGSVAAAAASINISAGTTSNNLTNLVFSNTNGVTFGIDGSTITASIPNGAASAITLSSYQNLDGYASFAQTWNSSSVSHGAAFLLPYAVSFDYLRFFGSMGIMANTTVSVSNTTQNVSAAKYSTVRAAIYSFGSGASADSLYSVMSASAGSTFLHSMSVNTVSTQASYTMLATWVQQDVTKTLSATTALSNPGHYSFYSSAFSNFTLGRMFDLQMSGSLPAGNYWIFAGTSGSTAGDSFISRATGAMPSYNNHYAGLQMNINFYEMGTAATTPIQAYLGAGSVSTAGGASISEMDFTKITAGSAHAKILFQLKQST